MLEKQNNQRKKSAIYEIPKERNDIRIGDDGKEPLSGGVSGPYGLLKGVHWPPLSPNIIPTKLN